MPKYLSNILCVLVLITAFGYYGCSSSSYSSRYGDDKEDKEEPSNQRFSDDNDLTETTDSLSEDIDEIPEEQGIDITSVMNKISLNDDGADLNADNSTLKEKMLMEIIKYLNTPYKYGGNSDDGIDCSAFTKTVYHNVLSVELNRSARGQYKQGTKIKNPGDLRFGDLVFFNTRRRIKPGHVGIYIGDNLFAHASSKNGVIVSSMEKGYYLQRFMGGRRIEAANIF
jgi:cell wall-associated NlpC family hydrolase